MAVWAYACRPCRGESDETVWYLSVMDVEELSPDIRIVRVKVGGNWRCAILDRSQHVEVEGMLVRQVIGTDAIDCSECEDI